LPVWIVSAMGWPAAAFHWLVDCVAEPSASGGCVQHYYILLGLNNKLLRVKERVITIYGPDAFNGISQMFDSICAGGLTGFRAYLR
jgi:hypothetical protein